VGKPEGRHHLKDISVDGRVILKRKEVVWEGVDCIVVAQDRDRWRAVVIAVMNFRVP
jgi:hypothetical protein